jgi:hypothetical protein
MLVTSVARAEPQRVTARLLYAVAAESGCPDETSFRDLVSARLGYDPFDGAGAVRVSVEITRQRGKLQGHTEIARGSTPPGSRDLFGERDRCEPLATAIATTVAIALDPGQAAVYPDPPAAFQPEAAPAAPANTIVLARERDVARPQSTPPSSPAERVGLVGFAGGVGSVALAPAPTLGPELGLVLGTKKFSLEASARAETIVGDARATSGDQLEVSIFSGALVPCAHLGPLSGCAFARIGTLQSRAPNVSEPELHSRLFAAVGFRGAYTLPLGSALSLRAALETGLPIVRTALAVDGAPVWTAPPVFAGASFAALVKFL